VSTETIRKTFQNTTQYGTKGRIDGQTLKQRIISPNPILNIPRRQEDVATDSIYSNTPAVDDGSTVAQVFIGRTSHYRTVHPLGATDANFPRVLMDEIRRLGAMNRIISDNAKAQISDRVKDILQTFAIKQHNSEARKGDHNFAERGWQDSKRMTNNLMNITNAPPYTWLLALQYVCFLQNHLARRSLGWRCSVEWILGFTPDISVLLQFEFWEPVFYALYESGFPRDSMEHVGRFIGIHEDIGNPMTFKVLTAANKIIG